MPQAEVVDRFLAQGFGENGIKRKKLLITMKSATLEKPFGTDYPQVSCSFSNIITPSDLKKMASKFQSFGYQKTTKKNIPRTWKSHLNLTKLMVIVHLILWESKGEMPPATPRNKDSLRAMKPISVP